MTDIKTVEKYAKHTRINYALFPRLLKENSKAKRNFAMPWACLSVPCLAGYLASEDPPSRTSP